jgi:hypothetical protein
MSDRLTTTEALRLAREHIADAEDWRPLLDDKRPGPLEMLSRFVVSLLAPEARSQWIVDHCHGTHANGQPWPTRMVRFTSGLNGGYSPALLYFLEPARARALAAELLRAADEAEEVTRG